MTYAELVAYLPKLTNKPQIVQSIPVFVTLMEADLNRRLAVAGLTLGQGRATSTVGAGVEYWDAPDDIARLLYLVRKGDGVRVENVTQASFEDLLRCNPGLTGAPAFFTYTGGAFRLFPIPDADYELELVYQRSLAGLTDANQSNWVMAANPDVYVYGALWKAAEFTQEPDKVNQYLPLYERAVDALIVAERDRAGARRSTAYRPHLPLSPGLVAGYEPFER